MAGAVAIVRVNSFVFVPPRLSLALSVNLLVPTPVGVPLIVPAGLRVSPGVEPLQRPPVRPCPSRCCQSLRIDQACFASRQWRVGRYHGRDQYRNIKDFAGCSAHAVRHSGRKAAGAAAVGTPLTTPLN